jgi:hypothetical protein
MDARDCENKVFFLRAQLSLQAIPQYLFTYIHDFCEDYGYTTPMSQMRNYVRNGYTCSCQRVAPCIHDSCVDYGYMNLNSHQNWYVRKICKCSHSGLRPYKCESDSGSDCRNREMQSWICDHRTYRVSTQFDSRGKKDNVSLVKTRP